VEAVATEVVAAATVEADLMIGSPAAVEVTEAVVAAATEVVVATAAVAVEAPARGMNAGGTNARANTEAVEGG
jgi:hypothetical protein